MSLLFDVAPDGSFMPAFPSQVLPCTVAFVTAVLLFSVGPSPVAAQSDDPPSLQEEALEHVRDAFARGDARALLEYATERIEVTLLGRSTHYSRSQAIYVMEEFFRDYPPEQFAAEETAGSDGSWFMAYEYWSSRGQAPMQVFIRIRTHSEHWEVREIRVEQQRR